MRAKVIRPLTSTALLVLGALFLPACSASKIPSSAINLAKSCNASTVNCQDDGSCSVVVTTVDGETLVFTGTVVEAGGRACVWATRTIASTRLVSRIIEYDRGDQDFP